ncbi:MAG TPA: hypothetical protein ACFCUC_02775 [Desulfobacterales bacterium]
MKKDFSENLHCFFSKALITPTDERRRSVPTEMKDEDKGGEDRVKKMKEEQQKEMEKKGPDEVGKYPEAEGETKKDVPPGT